MESLSTMFRLKIAYQAENQETGEMEKVKEEILSECANYTDAEAVLTSIVEQYNLGKFGSVPYEIVKCKFSRHQLYVNDLIESDDENKTLTCGLLNCSFVDGMDGLYAVDVIIFGNKAEKEKDVKDTYFIPANDPADATHKAKEILGYGGHSKDDYAITNVKFDKATSMYFVPSSFESMKELSLRIFG